MRPTAIILAAVTLLSAALAGCTTNPATGRTQFNALSKEQEIALGEEAKGQLTDEYGGRVKDPQLQAYVTEVGQRLLAGIEPEYRDLPWEFILLDSDVINAFALPGGKVFMSRGLAQKMTDEAQLAGVLGHEIGHVTAEHADKRISSNLILQGLIVGAAIGAGQAEAAWIGEAVPQFVGAAGQGFLMKFSRDEESEADSLGLRYMTRAGYDPRGQVDVMEILKSASGGRGGSPEWLSTHPLPETRIDRLEREINERYRGTRGERYPERFEQRFLSRVGPAPRAAASEPAPAHAVLDDGPAATAFSRFFQNRHDPAYCLICSPNLR